MNSNPKSKIANPKSADSAECFGRGRQSDSVIRFPILDFGFSISGLRARLLSFTLCALLIVFCERAEAQQPARIARIGFLAAGSSSSEAPRINAFRAGLAQLGYIEGQNVTIEYRYSEGRRDQLPILAADLVRLKVDVIVAAGTPITYAKKATSTLPIVMAVSTDPVASGYVDTLARPGRNITGLSSMARELSSKRLELFKEAVPKLRRLAVIKSSSSEPAFSETMQTVAQSLSLRMQQFDIHKPEDLENVFVSLTSDRPDGLFTVASTFLTASRKQIVEFAAKNKVAGMYHNEDFIAAGGLATSTIPIVVGAAGDLVAANLVASLARPGGNVTGSTRMSTELGGKRIELIKDTVPKLSRIAVISSTATSLLDRSEFKEMESVAPQLGVKLQRVEVKDPKDFQSGYAAIVREHANAVIILHGSFTLFHRKPLVELAIKNRLPSMCEEPRWSNAGCLMSYGPDVPHLHRRSAIFVDKILKGAKPADLPVEQPTKFEFVINLKTTKQIGLTIPQSVLYRADKVIK
jgi:ABC-type uncharacterized transport system substrate-binding protein